MNERELFIKSIEQSFKDCLDLIRKKNQDYAGVGDPFANFRNSEMAGVSIERGILVRVMDKISRISNLLERDAAVIDESLEDTLLDLINYTAILKAYLEHRERKSQP